MNEEKLLADSLEKYVREKHTQDECIGFIDGFKEALSLFAVNGSAEFKAWDDLFGILAWKFKPTKSGDMYLDGEAVYNELKEKFDLRRK